MDNSWQPKHLEVIKDFLLYLNKNSSDFILKGGTSLLLCYGLDRFSEDIDLDGKASGNHIPSSLPLIESFCKLKGFGVNIKKRTNWVERAVINYNDNTHLLKIETSFRDVMNKDYDIKKDENTGILVYGIEDILMMKVNAINQRTKIRDFYDVCFIVNNYWDKLSRFSKNSVRNLFATKDCFEYADFLSNTQKDDLVIAEKLQDNFLKAYEKTGLMKNEDNKKKSS